MDPVTLSLILAGVSSGFQLLSGVQQADQVSNNAALSKKIFEMNAEFADIDAYEALKSGLTEEARYAGVIDHTIGSQRAAFAANDVDANYGTAKEIQADTKLTGYLNLLDIRNHAHDVANGFKREASSYRLKNEMNQIESTTKESAYRVSALANAGSAYATYKYNQIPKVKD